MEIKSKFVKTILIGGIIGISITALCLDFTGGRELAMFGLVGLIALTKGD